MKGGINFEEWKEIVKKNRRSLRSKSNIFRFEPESLTYGAEKAVKSPEYGQVHTITYNITGDIDTTGWPTEIKSGKTLTLSGITTPYGGGMAFDSNQPYQYSRSTGKLTINDVLKDLTVNITVIPPMYENASVGDYLYDDWTFGKTEKEGWIARCAGTNGSGENKKTVWCSRATGSDLKWSTEWVDTGLTNYSTSTAAKTDMSGKENTAYLVSQDANMYEAAAWAAQQFNGLGYLPSVGEWDKYREKLYYYSIANRGFWWTSTEESDTGAYVLTENNYFSRESKKSLSYYNNDYSKNKVKAFCQLSGPCGIPINNNGHEYVDLGLPSGTLWATMNVGANSETDAGLYFAWGETTGYTADQVEGTAMPHKNFYWNDYAFGRLSPFSKYDQDGPTNLELTDDAARVNMGGDWHMPTKEQFEELLNTTYVTNTWVTNYNGSGVNGHLFTSVSNGNTMFVPAAGSCNYDTIKGGDGKVWTSTINLTTVSLAYALFFNSNKTTITTLGYGDRCYGYSVRGVIG